MKFRTSDELVFDLGGDGTLGGDSGSYTPPPWVYDAIPLDLTVTQSVVITAPAA